MREFDLLRHVYTHNASLGAAVAIPPGDDMAMVRAGGAQVLAAVDQLVAGRHVDLAATPLELVGRKAITRSLSDIAAMAARPLATLVAATLPPDFGEGRANELFDAMHQTAARYGCPLIGGDIAFHSDPTHPLVCSVTVLAVPGDDPPVTRSGARPGDGIYITGRLGGSLEPDGGGRHLHFEPRIVAALELAAALGADLHAMIDLSDGLGRDAGHIAEMSNVRIELDAALIPCNDDVDWRRALADGEDYELCFTAAGAPPARLGDVPVTRVGNVLPNDPDQPRVIVRDGEARLDASDLGWQHQS